MTIIDPNNSFSNDPLSNLIQRIRASADQLQADRTDRGDLKILSRTLRELRYAFKVFAPYRLRRKIAIFGSSRTLPEEPAYQLALELGRAMAREDWLVVTGAASGIMEAGHRGAGRENSMGLNILLPFEQQANEVIRDDHKLVNMKYFFTRKLMFVKECDAVVCLPGGFGTLDEGLEVLTLLQTGKREMVPVVFLDEPGGTYWSDFHRFVEKHLLGGKMIAPEDLAIYKLSDRVDETVSEILRFYRLYHSMRFVRKQLAIRLQGELRSGALEEIKSRFADLLADGDFQQRAALPEESDEPHLGLLPRLVFHFNRRNYARLRLLIDFINADA